MKDFGIFFENHDNPRFRSSYGTDNAKYENAITATLTWTGVPYLYYGCE